ncbi:MAG: NIPSNAP family protein [Deltaproteobacteria bacterium]
MIGPIAASDDPRNLATMTDTIFELRDYLLHAGQREALVTLFESEFIAPQNAVGAHVRGMFADPAALDHFVWLRSFADMAARKFALESFYGGDVWYAHKAAANATMIDSDNVDLLVPLLAPRHVLGTGPMVLDILPAESIASHEIVAASGPTAICVLTSAGLDNNFPRLPVNTRSVHVVLWREDGSGAPNYETPPSRRVLQPTQHSVIR